MLSHTAHGISACTSTMENGHTFRNIFSTNSLRDYYAVFKGCSIKSMETSTLKCVMAFRSCSCWYGILIVGKGVTIGLKLKHAWDTKPCYLISTSLNLDTRGPKSRRLRSNSCSKSSNDVLQSFSVLYAKRCSSLRRACLLYRSLIILPGQGG